jgi:outer membrane protein assembly factor BamD
VRLRSTLVILLTVLAGCGGPAPRNVETLPSAEADWLKGQRYFQEEDYVRAVEVLSAFVESHPGSNQLDQALFLLGRARQETRENLVAVEDFNRLIRDFPQSPLREQAEFERARSYLEEILGPTKDPETTETALSLLKAYVQRYPQGAYVTEAQKGIEECLERLATKAYLNAKVYLRLKHDRAAVIYLEKALATKPDFSRSVETRAELARAYTRLRESAKAGENWQKLLAETTAGRPPDADLREDLRREAQEELARLPVSDTADSTR